MTPWPWGGGKLHTSRAEAHSRDMLVPGAMMSTKMARCARVCLGRHTDPEPPLTLNVEIARRNNRSKPCRFFYWASLKSMYPSSQPVAIRRHLLYGAEVIENNGLRTRYAPIVVALDDVWPPGTAQNSKLDARVDNPT